jgi:hypothetical protein
MQNLIHKMAFLVLGLMSLHLSAMEENASITGSKTIKRKPELTYSQLQSDTKTNREKSKKQRIGDAKAIEEAYRQGFLEGKETAEVDIEVAQAQTEELLAELEDLTDKLIDERAESREEITAQCKAYRKKISKVRANADQDVIQIENRKDHAEEQKEQAERLLVQEQQRVAPLANLASAMHVTLNQKHDLITSQATIITLQQRQIQDLQNQLALERNQRQAAEAQRQREENARKIAEEQRKKAIAASSMYS